MTASAEVSDADSHNEEQALGRTEVLARYRRLREIAKEHHRAALKFVSRDTILRYGRSMGLADGKFFFVQNHDDFSLVCDLAVYSAPPRRSRALDRYARSVRPAPGSDEAHVLAAMCDARFSFVKVDGRHPLAGLNVTDMFHDTGLWLLDLGLEASVPAGTILATRYFALDRFVMTSGIGLPVVADLLPAVFKAIPALQHKYPAEVAGHRRFAEAVYRAAIAKGLTNRDV